MRKLFKNISPSSLIGFVISAILLWLLLEQSSLEWESLLNTIRSKTAIAYICLAITSFILIVVVQSFRVRSIFVDRHTSFKDISAYPSVAIGNMYNCLLPGNLGEGVRAWHFSKVNNKPITQSASIFVTEKILGATLALPIFISSLFYFRFIGHPVQYALLGLVAGTLLCILIVFVLNKSKAATRLVFRLIPIKSFRKTLYKIYLHFVFHYRRIIDNRSFPAFIFFTYLMFVLNVLQCLFVLKAVNLDAELVSVSTAVVLSLSMMLFMIIPSAPGNIGVAHYGIYIALMFVAEVNGIETSQMLQQKFAIVGICIHFSYYIPEILIGLFYVLKDHKTLFQFTAVKI